MHNLIEQVDVSTNLLKEHEHLFASQGPKVKQFMDIFSIPEMTLLAVANHFFITNNIEYDPVHLFKDVSVRALTDSHGVRRYSFRFKWAPYFPMLRGTLVDCIGLFSYTVSPLSLDALGSFL